MVDHIHLPKRLAPLFPAERIKKVRRRKDKQQDPGFKDNLEKEKKEETEEPEADDSYQPSPERKKAAAVRSKRRSDRAAAASDEQKKPLAEDTESEKRIDVHA